MSRDFLDDLVNALGRVLSSPPEPLKEILILSGMPENTENLRYLAYNRHQVADADRQLVFSAVAVINNRRMHHWRLKGISRTLSRMVFHPLWTRRNSMDLFLNNLRCEPTMTGLLAAARSDYTLMGILQTVAPHPRRGAGVVRPVLALPGLLAPQLATVAAFETANQLHE